MPHSIPTKGAGEEQINMRTRGKRALEPIFFEQLREARIISKTDEGTFELGQTVDWIVSQSVICWMAHIHCFLKDQGSILLIDHVKNLCRCVVAAGRG